MNELKDNSPISTQKINVQNDMMLSVETNFSGHIESNLPTHRIRKSKQIKDLGFEEKQTKKKTAIQKTNRKIIQTPITNKTTEICQNIFIKLKDKDSYINFPLFKQIEKQLKLNKYENHKDMALDIRNIFNSYFTASLHDPIAYSETVKYSQYFEDIYRDYENKVFWKDSKNVLELKKKMNRLSKEIRERNTNNIQNLKSNKVKIDINDYNVLLEKERRTSKKYKMSLVNNIRSLNSEQIKGIINIIHDNLRVDDKTMEFDINSLSLEKLKELDKYVKKCLKIKTKKSLDNINTEITNNTPKILNTNCNAAENINLNININNNFLVGKSKGQGSILSNNNILNKDVNTNLKKRNSILSDTDSISSDDESDESNSLSSLSLGRKISRDI